MRSAASPATSATGQQRRGLQLPPPVTQVALTCCARGTPCAAQQQQEPCTLQVRCGRSLRAPDAARARRQSVEQTSAVTRGLAAVSADDVQVVQGNGRPDPSPARCVRDHGRTARSRLAKTLPLSTRHPHTSQYQLTHRTTSIRLELYF